jgi:transposase
MSEHSTPVLWIGMDVHKSSTTLAILSGGSDEAEVLKTVSTVPAIRKIFRKLSHRGVPRGCYEASGAGYVLQRGLDRSGFHCDVIASGLIPRRPGDRRKNDRLDAINLARHYRAGNLTTVTVPDEDREAARQLVRSRLAVQRHITRLKHRIVRVMATHGCVFSGTKSNWTVKHRAWLRQLQHDLKGVLAVVLATHLAHLEYLEEQRANLDANLVSLSGCDPWRGPVAALRCFRGIDTLTAMTLVTEIGDIRRFKSARGLMAYTGLVPGERASGDTCHRGPLTKTGNAYLRRVLIEAAWHHRHKVGADQKLKNRRQGQNPLVVAIAHKAQSRLHRRFYRLSERKGVYKAVAAVARELCGFIWAAMMTVSEEA